MSGVRLLQGLKTPYGEPLIYIDMDNEGWFSLRQLVELFFPNRTEENMQLLLWAAKYLKSGVYYNTVLRNSVYKQLFNFKITCMLDSLVIKVNWIVDIQTAKNMLHILDPKVSAKKLMSFNNILTEMLRKGGRKRAVTNKERMKIAASQGWKCNICEVPFGHELNFEVDHILRWSDGGSNRSINLQALCPNCHAKKTSRDTNQVFEDFRCLSIV